MIVYQPFVNPQLDSTHSSKYFTLHFRKRLNFDFFNTFQFLTFFCFENHLTKQLSSNWVESLSWMTQLRSLEERAPVNLIKISKSWVMTLVERSPDLFSWAESEADPWLVITTNFVKFQDWNFGFVNFGYLRQNKIHNRESFIGAWK